MPADPLRLPPLLLGFALGGFFDGVLLHQILQWHHLLSLAPGLSSLRMQVLWDGYFHALMYAIAAVALWRLWRARDDLGGEWGGRGPGALLVGFGAWHLVDAVLAHWVLGIHRVRVDSPDPLMWDLIWLAAFGLVPLAGGAVALRRRGSWPARKSGSGAVMLLGLVAAGLGVWALQPPRNQPDFTTVVFRPGAGPAAVFGAMRATDARLVWTDADMSVVVFSLPPSRRWTLYRHGALLVTGAALPAGCLDWSRA